MDNKEKQLWKEYKKTKNIKIRNIFINQYLPLVKYIVNKIVVKISQNVELIEYGDFISYGILGLFDAIEKFDLSRDTKFKTYAFMRIQGAIYDECRKLDWVPRKIRQEEKKLKITIDKLENKLGRKPTSKEIADYNKMSLKEYSKLCTNINQTVVSSLECPLNINKKSISNLEIISSDMVRPDVLYEKNEVKELMKEIISKLPKKERKIIILYYYEGLTYKEIGKVFNVTEARISQILIKSLRYLKFILITKRLKTGCFNMKAIY